MRQVLGDNVDWERWIQEAARSEAPLLKPQEHYADLIDKEFENHGPSGDMLPWAIMDDKFRLRPGEVTLWAGINGHGKSQMLGQVMLWQLPHSVVTVASLEMPVPKTARRLLRQASGQEMPSKIFRARFDDYSFGKLWYYDQSDMVEFRRIMGLVAYASKELGSKHIVIDSLMKLGMAEDGYNEQKRAVDTLCQMAKRFDVHIHLVVHMRKGESEDKIPDKFDVMGSSSITNLADNLVIVHRNKRKERIMESGSEEEQAKVIDHPDQTITIAKQRHWDWEGKLALWYDRPSQQYIRRPDLGAIPWPSPEDQWLHKWAQKGEDNGEA